VYNRVTVIVTLNLKQNVIGVNSSSERSSSTAPEDVPVTNFTF
jgi:hypothetical protein